MSRRIWTKPFIKYDLSGDRELAKSLERKARACVGYLFDQLMPNQKFRSQNWNYPDGSRITAFVWRDVLGERAIAKIYSPGGGGDSGKTIEFIMETGYLISEEIAETEEYKDYVYSWFNLEGYEDIQNALKSKLVLPPPKLLSIPETDGLNRHDSLYTRGSTQRKPSLFSSRLEDPYRYNGLMRRLAQAKIGVNKTVRSIIPLSWLSKILTPTITEDLPLLYYMQVSQHLTKRINCIRINGVGYYLILITPPDRGQTGEVIARKLSIPPDALKLWNSYESESDPEKARIIEGFLLSQLELGAGSDIILLGEESQEYLDIYGDSGEEVFLDYCTQPWGWCGKYQGAKEAEPGIISCIEEIIGAPDNTFLWQLRQVNLSFGYDDDPEIGGLFISVDINVSPYFSKDGFDFLEPTYSDSGRITVYSDNDYFYKYPSTYGTYYKEGYMWSSSPTQDNIPELVFMCWYDKNDIKQFIKHLSGTSSTTTTVTFNPSQTAFNAGPCVQCSGVATRTEVRKRINRGFWGIIDENYDDNGESHYTVTVKSTKTRWNNSTPYECLTGNVFYKGAYGMGIFEETTTTGMIPSNIWWVITESPGILFSASNEYTPPRDYTVQTNYTYIAEITADNGSICSQGTWQTGYSQVYNPDPPVPGYYKWKVHKVTNSDIGPDIGEEDGSTIFRTIPENGNLRPGTDWFMLALFSANYEHCIVKRWRDIGEGEIDNVVTDLTNINMDTAPIPEYLYLGAWIGNA